MNKISILKIKIQNFGGVAQGEYNFNEGKNVLEYSSGTGKTTAYLAYLWALGFTIPTWEPLIDGYRVSKLKTEVEVELNVNGMIYKIGKINHPKYKINKFTGEEEYTGSDFRYLFDGAEQDKKETYQNKIAELFNVDYFTLELLCNLSLFNGNDEKRWNKNERRKFLFKLFDLDNELSKLINDKDFEEIKDELLKCKDELEIKDILNTMKLNIDNEMKQIQTLIEDRQNELAEYSDIDFDEIENQEKLLDKKLEQLYLQEKESAKNSLYKDKQEELNKLYNEYNKLKNCYDNELRNYELSYYNYEKQIKSIELDISFCKQNITTINSELEDLENDKEIISEEKFNEKLMICPTCNQTLPSEKIESLKLDFENKKTIRLQDIDLKTEKQSKELQNKKNRLKILESQKQSLQEQFEDYKKTKPVVVDYTEKITKIENLKKELLNIDNVDINQELKLQIQETKNQHKNILNELSKKQIKNNIIEKINKLKERARELGEQDSERIAKKLALQKYTQRKVNLINTKVNERFEGVRYNFFKWNNSTAEKEYIDICTAVLSEINTEYESLSSGQKIKVNLFTNTSLRNILGVNIPQFVDDVVLSDLDSVNKNWQTIYLLTDTTKTKKPKNVLLIRDCYTLKDCDIKNKE